MCVLLALAACRPAQTPAADDAAPAGLQPVTYPANADLLFVYADPSGRFETTRDRTTIPEVSRSAVRVIDPTVTSAGSGEHGQVHVANLARAGVGSAITAVVVARRDFERTAIAALPPGRASSVQPLGAPEGEVNLAPHDDVIVYGTRWCGACKQTVAFLNERGVSYIEKDVESDPAAAAELRGKARNAGISPDRVPIIDVRGEALVVGFDPVRLSTLIGDPT